jgi:hypothetical protein
MGAAATAYQAVASWFAAHGTAAAIGKAALTAAASAAATKAFSDDESSATTTTAAATTSPTSGQTDTNTSSAKRDALRKNALRRGLASTIKAGGLGNLGTASTTKTTLTGKKSLLGE